MNPTGSSTLRVRAFPGSKGSKTWLTYIFWLWCGRQWESATPDNMQCIPALLFWKRVSRSLGNPTHGKFKGMTVSICGNWLDTFDKRMILESRKMLLLFDNFSGHTLAVNTSKISNITVHFSPKNMTNILPPKLAMPVLLKSSSDIVAAVSYHKPLENTRMILQWTPKNVQHESTQSNVSCTWCLGLYISPDYLRLFLSHWNHWRAV